MYTPPQPHHIGILPPLLVREEDRPLVFAEAQALRSNPLLAQSLESIGGIRWFLPPRFAAACGAPARGEVRAIADDNRCAILPQQRVDLSGQGFVLSVKGVGTRSDLYGDGPMTEQTAARMRGVPARAGEPLPELESPWVTSEEWFGSSAYGAQGLPNTDGSLALSALASPDDPSDVCGFRICPSVAVVALPEEAADFAAQHWWLRRFDGPAVQELRLVPSNVRVYFGGSVSAGNDPMEVIAATAQLSSLPLEERILRMLASGVAATTVLCRTLRPAGRGDLGEEHGLFEGPGWVGMDYRDVWLDKDAVIAPDGTLYFADLEGLEPVRLPTPGWVHKVQREQFGRTCYELFYAVTRLWGAAMELEGQPVRWAQWRQTLAGLLPMALQDDPIARTEWEGQRLWLLLHPPGLLGETVRVPLLDLPVHPPSVAAALQGATGPAIAGAAAGMLGPDLIQGGGH